MTHKQKRQRAHRSSGASNPINDTAAFGSSLPNSACKLTAYYMNPTEK